MIFHLQQTTSTNDEARNPRYRHGDLIWAECQTAGRGQRGHTWTSPEGANLTFSAVLEPHFLPIAEQFLLCEAVALALTDTFDRFGIETRIKWTNDIYAGDRKLVGILIEHNCSDNRLSRTIVGIGINVNQLEFDPSLPNPVSMAQLCGHPFDRAEVLGAFHGALLSRYGMLERGDREALHRNYTQRLYRLGRRGPFRLPDGTPVEATVEGVEPTGALLLRHDEGCVRRYLFREVEFVWQPLG